MSYLEYQAKYVLLAGLRKLLFLNWLRHIFGNWWSPALALMLYSVAGGNMSG
jgi:hypothetical protein